MKLRSSIYNTNHYYTKSKQIIKKETQTRKKAIRTFQKGKKRRILIFVRHSVLLMDRLEVLIDSL